MAGTDLPGTARIPALDGLRGAAAAVVVLYHVSLVGVPFTTGMPLGHALQSSPAALLVAGPEAVLVFFVLSGVALSRQYRALDQPRVLRYLGSRFVRLYVPVWAALLLGSALILLLPRDAASVTPGSWLLNTNATVLSWHDLAQEATLTALLPRVDNVLWSLCYEVVFSLVVPLVVPLAARLRRPGSSALLVAAAALSGVGWWQHVDALRFLPVFVLGVALDGLVRPGPAAHGATRTSLTVAGLVLLAGGVAAPSYGATVEAAGFGSVVGAVLLVASQLVPGRSLLATRPFVALGRWSFSLYLVHLPIVATLGFLLGDRRWWLVALIAIPLSFATAIAFHRVVERPTHLLARSVLRLHGRVVLPASAALVPDARAGFEFARSEVLRER